MTGMTQPHVEPPQIHIIKENQDCKSGNDSLKLKLCRYPTLRTSDLYEFKISLFDNGDPEEFCCLFVTSTRPSRYQGL